MFILKNYYLYVNLSLHACHVKSQLKKSNPLFLGELQAKRSNNSLASLSSHSNSPTSSPYGSQYLDQKMQGIYAALVYF